MDQQLIAIILLFGFRSLLLVIPALDYLFVWAMRRFFNCCNSSDGPGPGSREGGAVERVIELHPMALDGEGPWYRQPLSDSENSGIVIILLLFQLLASITMDISVLVDCLYFLLGLVCFVNGRTVASLLLNGSVFQGRLLLFSKVWSWTLQMCEILPCIGVFHSLLCG